MKNTYLIAILFLVVGLVAGQFLNLNIMKSEQFEVFRIKSLEKIRGGATIYCKDRDGNNLGTVEHTCGQGTSGLTACKAVYPLTEQSAGPC